MEFWWRPLLHAAGLVLLFFLLGGASASGPAMAALAALLAGYVLHLLLQLKRVDDWLRRPEQPAPRGSGVWGDVLYRLDKLLRGGNERQQKAAADLEQILYVTGALPEGIVILDADERIVWLNDAAGRHLGLTRERDSGQFIHYLLRGARFLEWLALEDTSQRLTYRVPGGSDRTLSLQQARMPRGQRLLISHDVTEAERLDAMRRDFVANVSHELRTPITVITGFLEAFDEMDAPEPKTFKKHVHLMREQSDRLRRLLDDLLMLARLEGNAEMKNETVDIDLLCRRMLEDARALSQGRHEIQLRMDSRARLLGNEQELHSAFGNLVSNAVRYTPDGGAISLRWAENPSGGGEFSVTDTGEGIEAKHIPRLTERFYRVDRGRSRASGGTGLGLAIVKHILQRHQGRLRVDSTPGKGSVFTAVFPAERLIPAVSAAPRPPGQGAA
ncbi:MAG: phosphate regulon sensor histidine kinase PhoR [Thiobacillaceae bacterium]|nr:phosphate regulon sensor histidine kinase PhoR [Thiobacillaceae bacterium]